MIVKKCGEYKVDTIYIGGGTPSFIDGKYIVEILNVVIDKFNVEKECEITIEVNPRYYNTTKV